MLLEEVIYRKPSEFAIFHQNTKFVMFSLNNFFQEHFVTKACNVIRNQDKISRHLIPILIFNKKKLFWDLLLEGVSEKLKFDEKYITQRIFFCIFIMLNTFPCNIYYLLVDSEKFITLNRCRICMDEEITQLYGA